jgi:hypothetical protein
VTIFRGEEVSEDGGVESSRVHLHDDQAVSWSRGHAGARVLCGGRRSAAGESSSRDVARTSEDNISFCEPLSVLFRFWKSLASPPIASTCPTCQPSALLPMLRTHHSFHRLRSMLCHLQCIIFDLGLVQVVEKVARGVQRLGRRDGGMNSGSEEEKERGCGRTATPLRNTLGFWIDMVLSERKSRTSRGRGRLLGGVSTANSLRPSESFLPRVSVFSPPSEATRTMYRHPRCSTSTSVSDSPKNSDSTVECCDWHLPFRLPLLLVSRPSSARCLRLSCG